MSELSRLISRLNKAILVKVPYLKNIRHPELLVDSLEELNNLIGNETVKDSVATQVSYLIAISSQTSQDSYIYHKEDRVMLNTVLYGKPGVGKTLVGTKLAKIWYSLGYLDGSRKKKEDMCSPEQERKKEIEALVDKLRGISDEKMEKYSDIIKYSILVVWFLSLCSSLYISCGAYWTAAIVVVLLYVLFTADFEEEKPILDDLKQNQGSDEEEGGMPSDEEIITVVSRADFVGKYVGWSDKKTLKLLNDNLGKVLFVDEAYSLVTNGFDSFGIEVLNTINLFLSEHPGEIIVIFAGYKDLMESGIFSFQPGLCRRFMWHFECEGYSSGELFKIFAIQLEKTGWELTNYQRTRSLFRRYKDDFPNFGGDTERLTFFAKLEHSREYLEEDQLLSVKLLTPKHVRRGIRVLQKNNIKKQKSQNNFANIMQTLANH